MANQIQLIFNVDPGGQGQQTLVNINNQIQGMGHSAVQAGAQIDQGMAVFRGTLIADFFRQGASQALQFSQDAVAAFNQAEAAALGLQSAARFQGISGGDATSAVRNLDIVKAGLISVSDASTAVKNLLSAGFGLPESIEIVKRFADSAAFGRQSSLSFGEAIRSAAEGVKNQNSILLDNAGITKNISIILKEAGFQMQDLSDKTKGTAARMALYQGLLKETQGQVGDAAKLTGTFAGQQAQLEASYQKLLVATGAQIAKNKELSDGLKSLQKLISDYTDEVEKSGSATNNIIGSNVSAVGNLIKSFSELANTNIGKAFFDALPSLGQFYKLSKDIIDLINGGKPKSQESFVNLGIGIKDIEKREADLKKLNEILKQSDGRSFEDATNGAFNGKQLLERISLTERILALQKQQTGIAKELASVEAGRAQGKTIGEIDRDILGGAGSFNALKQKALEAEKALNQLTGDSSKKLSDIVRNIENPDAATSFQALEFLKAQTAEQKKAADAAAKLARENRQIEDSILSLRKQLEVNPLANLYDVAEQRQRAFLEGFRNATAEQREAYIKLNRDVLALDIFKEKLNIASTTNNLQLEIAKLQAGLGGASLRDTAARNAAERAAITKEIETRRGAGDLTGAQQDALLNKLNSIGQASRLEQLEADFRQKALQNAQGLLGGAQSAQEKNLALEQILRLTGGDIGKLSENEVSIRFKALTESANVQAQIGRDLIQQQQQRLQTDSKLATSVEKLSTILTGIEPGVLNKFIKAIDSGVNVHVTTDRGYEARIDRLPSND